MRLGFHFIPESWWKEQHGEDADPMVGQMVGDFLVVAPIGAGGFGRVFLGLQAPLFRLRGALKLLELPSNNAVVIDAMLQKFQQEAEALAELTHPNIVRLLKYGTHRERPYLVMEYLDGGRTLREEIWERAQEGESFTHGELLDILGQLLNALEAAHERSIIHRDIKPENIMLQAMAGHPNHVKVLDFGTAKFTEQQADTKWPLGSPSYMAPEQIEMKNIGPWSDLFAVGVLTFEMMSGRKPFPGESENSIVSKKLDRDYDPLTQLVGLDVPEKTIAFFRRALAFDPEARYRDGQMFRDGLGHAVVALGEQSTVVGPEGAELTSLLDSDDLIEVDQDEIPTRPASEPSLDVQRESDSSLGAEDAAQDESSESEPLDGELASALVDRSDTGRVAADAATDAGADGRSSRGAFVAGLALLAVVAVVAVGLASQGTGSGTHSAEAKPAPRSKAPSPTKAAPEPPTSDPIVVDQAVSAIATARDAAVTAVPSRRISAVTAGKFHSCVSLYDGRVRCWGANFDGELGLGHDRMIGDDEPLSDAPWIPFDDPVVQLESAGDRGSSFNCTLSVSGAVRCWGSNSFGQLGLGHTKSIGSHNRVGGPGHGAVQLGASAIDVAVGGAQYASHGCALLEGGAVRCWGGNKFGQLGLGHTRNIGDDETPATVEPADLGGSAIDVVAGKHHTCALLDDHSVRCWGYNHEGQLGYGHTENVGDDETPASAGPVDVGAKAVSLAAGRGHTCAVLEGGSVKCWGWNKWSQLGYGNTEDLGDDEPPSRAEVVEVGGDVETVVAGANHTCALLTDRSVKCWGDNRFGQLGYGHENPVPKPASVGAVFLDGEAVAIYAGSYHNCAILRDDVLRCWGFNKFGQLGLGHTEDIGDDETPASVEPAPVFDTVESQTDEK